MDINGLYDNYYEDFLKTKGDAANVKIQKAVEGVDGADDEELMGVCKQFESYLLEQVFKEMQKTIKITDDETESSVPGLGTGKSNALVDYFKDQTIAEISEKSTERDGLGLAQMLYESMKRQQ